MKSDVLVTFFSATVGMRRLKMSIKAVKTVFKWFSSCLLFNNLTESL